MEIIENFIIILSLHISICFTFFKICNYKTTNIFKILILSLFVLFFSFLQSIIDIPNIFKLFFIDLAYSLLLSKITNINFEKSFITTIISIAITFIFSIISAPLVLVMSFVFGKMNYKNLIFVILDGLLIFLFIFRLFKFKRFKNGFTFLNNQNKNMYLNTFILTLGLTIMLIYFLILCIDFIPVLYLFFSIVLFAIMLFFVIQHNFITYQTLKLQTKTLKDYESELSETKQKLETAISEKTNLVRSNHEFYQRQKALNKKLDDLLILQAHSSDVELGEEIGDIISRIDKMNDEYKTKTHTLPNLVKCNIKEIDDMFSYMQYECYKNNIDFILNFNCDIQYIIDNFITQTQLVTLLGDLISNSIIAINHSSNIFRSIMVVFGIKDNSYELCVFDSGIPFEISTLLNLGLKPASTHLDEGGSGSGFITTFETINSCNASFIINEITGTNYTKSLTIKFDGKNGYTIISDRVDKISEMNIDNRNINMNKTLY